GRGAYRGEVHGRVLPAPVGTESEKQAIQRAREDHGVLAFEDRGSVLADPGARRRSRAPYQQSAQVTQERDPGPGFAGAPGPAQAAAEVPHAGRHEACAEEHAAPPPAPVRDMEGGTRAQIE